MMKRLILSAVLLAFCWTAAAENATLEKAYTQECRRTELGGKPAPGVVAKAASYRRTMTERADKICEGIVFFHNQRKQEPITVGRRNIDWRGRQRKHQEWVAQLNRFFMLDPLAVAWYVSGDEKYPARARELMEDYMDSLSGKPADFADHQGGNLLNVAIRLNNWGRALIDFRRSSALDDAFVGRALAEYRRLADVLCRKTKPGLTNWQIAQASALVTASLRFPDLPGAEEWRKRGCEVLNVCFRQQFRSDGVHRENTRGYHSWMLHELVLYRRLQTKWPLAELDISDAVLIGGLDFLVLCGPFAFNDCGQLSRFPHAGNTLPVARALAAKAGIVNYRPPEAKVFPASQLVFGGNAREKFFFDAADHTGVHTHWSRLVFEYALDGFAVIPDLGVTTYDRYADRAAYLVGKGTPTHATVNFGGGHQLPMTAKLLDASVSPEFATAAGEFDGGYLLPPFKHISREVKPDIPAKFRRRVTWLPGEYILIFDRTSTTVKTDVRTVFPVFPVDRFAVDGLRFTGVNAKMPSVLIEMIVPASDKAVLTVIAGEEKKNRPGWKAVRGAGLDTAPELMYSAPATAEPATAVTLIAARSAGETLPEYKRLESSPGKLVIALPSGGRDEYKWAEDLSSVTLTRFGQDGKAVRTFSGRK